jgi:hypothetical protein
MDVLSFHHAYLLTPAVMLYIMMNKVNPLSHTVQKWRNNVLVFSKVGYEICRMIMVIYAPSD